MYIYILTNQINGMQYVGQSIRHPLSSGGRIYMHFTLRNTTCYRIHNAIKKYGKENFDYEILYYPYACQDALNHIEQSFIKSLNTLSPNGYNLQQGGNNSRPSDETKHKNSESNKCGAWKHRDEIIRLFNSGLSPNKIAKKYGCSRKPIVNILVKNGVKQRTISESTKGRKSWNEGKSYAIKQHIWDNKGNIIRDRDSGKSLRFLANKYNCSATSIRRVLKSN